MTDSPFALVLILSAGAAVTLTYYVALAIRQSTPPVVPNTRTQAAVQLYRGYHKCSRMINTVTPRSVTTLLTYLDRVDAEATRLNMTSRYPTDDFRRAALTRCRGSLAVVR